MAALDLGMKVVTAAAGRLADALSEIFTKHPVRIGFAVGLGALAVWTGIVYVERSDQYQEIVSTTVRSEMEDTPQRFKVLEAFLLSTVDEDLSEFVRNSDISEDFTKQLNQLDLALKSLGDTELRDVRVAVPDGVTEEWKKQSRTPG